MKKILPVILLALIIPQFAIASWWNPFSWKIFQEKTVSVENISPIKPTPTGSEVSNFTETKNIKESSTPSTPIDTYDVVKVTDGDTIDVSINGKIERLRLIGIDTPETVDPRKPVQCFGVEASNKAKTILTGKKVSLESDSTQGERDKYGRLLRYVFLEDGTNFNLMMIREGYAYEYTYRIPYKYQSTFKQAQKDAEAKNKGLWDSGVCEEKPTPTPITTKPKQTQTPP